MIRDPGRTLGDLGGRTVGDYVVRAVGDVEPRSPPYE